jgi:hypothetical protein
MKDEDLVDRFETGSLAPERFGHREHVRVTWIYLGRYGRAETERRLLRRLRELAARAGTPGRFNEPLTAAWVARIAAAAAASAPDHSFEDLVGRHPELLDPSAVHPAVPTI